MGMSVKLALKNKNLAFKIEILHWVRVGLGLGG